MQLTCFVTAPSLSLREGHQKLKIAHTLKAYQKFQVLTLPASYDSYEVRVNNGYESVLKVQVHIMGCERYCHDSQTSL